MNHHYPDTTYTVNSSNCGKNMNMLGDLNKDLLNLSYLGLGYITPTKLLTTNFISLVSLTLVSV